MTVLLGGIASAQPSPSTPETVFQSRCAACHQPAVDRAPARVQLAQLPTPQIVTALTTGLMAPMAAGLSQTEIQALAAHLGTAAQQQAGAGRPAAFAPKITDRMCATSRLLPTQGAWPAWGIDERNTRFQRNPGLRVADIPKLKVKWAFSYPGGSYGQPMVVGDHLFITSRSGTFYALDPASGCVRWKVDELVTRATPVVIRSDISPSGWVVFVAEAAKAMRAYDAANGKELWRTTESLDPHPTSRISGSPTYYQGRLFVGITGGEEGAGALATYACCSFRGSLVALDARTGKLLWKSYTVTEPLHPIRKNAQGVQLQGPAGGGIWSAATIDARRGSVLVGTANSTIDAPTTGTDAIIAFDMATGKERWRNQVTANDDYLVSCQRLQKPANCAANSGPDYDFGAPPILYRLKSGNDIVLAGQKSGVVYGFDPDTGKLQWKTKVGGGSSLGGIEFGMAADDSYVYAANSDLINLMEVQSRAAGKPVLQDRFFDLYGPPRPGLYALDPATGRVAWETLGQTSPCNFYGDRSGDRLVGCFPALSAAVTVIPGAIFAGSLDGWFRAYDTRTGKVIWAFNSTAQTYDTVNGVKGQPGGSIDGAGPTIAGGSVFTTVGYNGSSNVGGNGTNVLLAFSVNGK